MTQRAGDIADGIAAQQKSVESLVKVVLDDRIVFDFLLVQQGVCATTNTSYCTWINSSGELE